MFTKSVQQFILWSAICISPVTALANSTATNDDHTKATKSISYQTSQQLNKATKNKMLQQAITNTNSLEIQNALQTNTLAARDITPDFSVFDASTLLLNDDNNDGFYHRFSVTVDADTLFEHATVYADFYLSYEGGPWIYYASSDNYDIHTDSFDDSFTIETELADGYPTGYYDLRIKLYDAATDDYLLTYDSFDDSSLNAIPLEDSYRDEDGYYDDGYFETEIIVSHGAGSINFLSLFILFLFIMALRLRNIFQPAIK